MRTSDTTEQENKRGIIYCRVSSKDQLEGTSLETQERFSTEYAINHGIKVIKVFVERGESAKTANRTEFNKALAFCTDKKNKIQYFIVYKLDRFARNQDDHVTVKAILRRAEVELRSVTEPIDQTPIGRAMEGVLSVFAEFDNNVRTERTKQGMLERVQEGMWVWPTPLGYCRPFKGSNITPEPEVSPLIRLGFEEYSKGIYTYKSLAKFLSDRGLRTRGGYLPSHQFIDKMIKNPIYKGFIEAWGGHKGSFEAIVSEELFDSCQVSRKGLSHKAPRMSRNPLFPLRGVICKECSSPITGSKSTGNSGKKYPYYHHPHQHCSLAQSVPKENFEQLFVEFLNNITPDHQYEKLFKAVVLDIWQNNYKRFDEDNARVRREIAKLEQERQKVFDLHRTGIYTDSEFDEQRNFINRMIDEKRLLVHEKAVEEFDMEEALNYCFNFIKQTSKTWLEADFPHKLQFQKLIFKGNIEFDGKKFGTTKLSALYALNREYSGEKSHLVAPRGIEPRLQE